MYAHISCKVASLRAEVARHLRDSQRGEMVRSGLEVAIVGPPNAGKSTLLNLLAQRDAAIVSDVPGTTRDVLEVRAWVSVMSSKNNELPRVHAYSLLLLLHTSPFEQNSTLLLHSFDHLLSTNYSFLYPTQLFAPSFRYFLLAGQLLQFPFSMSQCFRPIFLFLFFACPAALAGALRPGGRARARARHRRFTGGANLANRRFRGHFGPH